MSDHIEVRVTAGSPEEADRLAGTVVGRRLAACAQIVGPIASVYWWDGEVNRSQEWLVLFKTTAERFGDLSGCVREVHSYDVPEIIAVPVAMGTGDYLSWIDRETNL
ncbi:divalent cation tolerance protein CutA [Herbidospora sp. NEAU-GS84]|uniref:Divalent cation tolerance protein CutA n=1 Tax=Herbidospora solisilvae TaxID=2696284 RepID=A0A7C9N9M7_9ACTN|nr:divalent-cation tolerance protein CutA [Herbidospora solisilvae]NAS25093.1 divalent cation tolerance protein CutA [Herbidospora solisilvae]